MEAMNPIIIEAPSMEVTKAQDAKALTLLDKARLIVVTNKDEYDTAVTFGRGLSTLEAEIIAHYKPMKQAADKAHKEACAAEAVHLEPVKEAKTITSKVCTAWKVAEDLRQQRAANEARAKQDAETEKRAAEERRRIEDERLKQAAEMEAAGHKEAAAALLEAPVHVPTMPSIAPIMPPDATKTEGASLRGTWDVEVFDLPALQHAVADGSAPSACTIPDMVYLRKRAKADKSELRIAGVRAVLKQNTNFRKG